MREWLEDPDNYIATLWIITIALLFTPVLAWLFYPTAIWIVSIVCVWALLFTWHEHLVSPDKWGLELGRHAKQPTGLHAIFVRLRLAIFGAVTTLIVFVAIFALMGGDILAPIVVRFYGLILLCIPGAVFSTHLTVMLLFGWETISAPPLALIEIWIRLTKKHAARKAAFQKIYNIENRFFVMIAGYQTSFRFRSKFDMLRENIPPIGNLP